MRINFFEEFSSTRNLDKLRLVDFPTDVVLAASNLNEFYGKRDEIKAKYDNVDEVVYWPVLEHEEGYWMSAFSKTAGLERVINELKQDKRELTVLWDAELPMMKWALFLTQSVNFFRNRGLILDFLKNAREYNKNIILCETCPKGFTDAFYKLAAVRFDDFDHAKVCMAYTSMLKKGIANILPKLGIVDLVGNQMRIGKQRYKGEFYFGLGTMGGGMLDKQSGAIEEADKKEPDIGIDALRKDLKTAEKAGIKKIYVFRLGGLTEEYAGVLKKHADLH